MMLWCEEEREIHENNYIENHPSGTATEVYS
jgi:hypothetical protein